MALELQAAVSRESALLLATNWIELIAASFPRTGTVLD